MNNFMNVFKEARASNSKFIFVGTKTEGSENVMVTTISADSFNEKEKFYNHSYSYNLVNVKYSGIRIFGWTHGGATAVHDLLSETFFTPLKGGEKIGDSN